MADTGYGFKALDPTGATYHEGQRFAYPLPQPGEKWGPWFAHPNPMEPDGHECGPGRLHVHKSLSLEYGPPGAYPWFVQWRGLIGEGPQKLGVRELRLRVIAPRTLARAMRPPFNWGTGANLYGANLDGANLYGANLRGANLDGADLSGANLYGANLRGANLSGANLYGANLRGANLRGADLDGADLSGANLYGANLSGANLYGADLRGADLYGANLDGAAWNEYTQWPAGVKPGEPEEG